MAGGFFLALALAALMGGWRILRKVPRGRTALDDEAIRRIEGEGRYSAPEEGDLDLDEIRREEREFWEETWDEPDRY